MKKVFSPGDRVASTVYGFYYGLPGRIVKPAQIQISNNSVLWIVALDVIDKRIALDDYLLEDLTDEEAARRIEAWEKKKHRGNQECPKVSRR